MRSISTILLGLFVGVFIVIALLRSADDQQQPGTGDTIHFRVPPGFPEPLYDISKNPPTSAGFELGRRLFYDPLLSSDYLSSCSSCHQRFAAFAHIDHALSHGVLGKIGLRNVPALQNLAWKDAFMADGGIRHLDLQPIAPLTSPIEMNESLASVLTKLRRDTLYPRLFKRAFGDTTISSSRMLRALSQFLLMLVSSNSSYDKMTRGELQFSEQENKGLQIFRERCTGCHTEPLFSDNSYRNLHLPIDTALRDSGRARITTLHRDAYRFKVPSLRNVELSYPYMHDGRFRTLKQVLDYYAHLDRNALRDPDDEELAKTAGLSDEDEQSLIVFLKTLSDTQFLHDLRFADPFRR